ncbi:homeobox domain-containing protein [Gongronella butleri]|nr:homeobox domain-containing protein [Gongronella butleri]
MNSLSTSDIPPAPSHQHHLVHSQHQLASVQQQQQQQQQEALLSKKRTRVTPSQLRVLEETFSTSATPDSKMRKMLAAKLQMPERSIQIWFQNRRAKVKLLHRRALLREEQEAARAKMYAEAAAAAAAMHQHQQHHHHMPPPPPLPSSTHAPHHQHQHQQHHHASVHGIPPPPPLAIAAAAAGTSYWYTSPTSTMMTPASAKSTSPTTTTTMMMESYQQHQHQQHHHGHHKLTAMDRCWSAEPLYSYSSSSNSSSSSSAMSASMPLYISPSPTPHPAPCSSSLDDLSSGWIHANAITIGTWHRMKINAQDLQCCFQLQERAFEWHIRDSSYHFKMVISFDAIACLDISILDNGIFAQMDIDLTEPPLFFMETMDDNNLSSSSSSWIQCSDFTEGMQATCHLHHTIRGLATDLQQDLLQMINMDKHLCQVIRFPTLETSAATSMPPSFDDMAATNTVMPTHLLADALPPLPF